MPAIQYNLYDKITRAYRGRDGAAVLLQSDDQTWSFEKLDRISAQLAAGMKHEGATAGDRILVKIDKSPLSVALYFACLRGAYVIVPLNTAYTDSEVDYFIGDAEPKLIVCESNQVASLRRRYSSTARGMGVFCLEQEEHPDSLLSVTAEYDRHDEIHLRQENDLAALIYTSGTTGRSKGAMLSHGNLFENASALKQHWQFNSTDTLLHALPIFHVHGLFIALNTALLSACRIRFLERFDIDQIFQFLPSSTVMMGVPTFYTRMLGAKSDGKTRLDKKSCDSIRLFISGSAPLSELTFNEFYQRSGQAILERYGMTETGILSSNPYFDSTENTPSGTGRIAGTVGYPLAGVEILICDDSGNALPANTVGAVTVRGKNVFQGYWRMPKKTASELNSEGWFITGDLGELAPDGRLSLVGRTKDLIISGGYNIYAKEIELCLDKQPSIAESAVIGLPDTDFGERVSAVCVPVDLSLLNGRQSFITDNSTDSETHPLYDTQRGLLSAISEELASYKRPKQIIWIESLPRNAMGKVQKNQLRNQFAGVAEQN